MRFFQAILASVAFVGYIFYQTGIEKKKFADIQQDMMAVAFFIAVWLGIYYFLIR
jgi:hypothetical protein